MREYLEDLLKKYDAAFYLNEKGNGHDHESLVKILKGLILCIPNREAPHG